MTLLCRPPGRGNHRLVIINISGPPDIVLLARFHREMRISFGDPAMVLRIVEVRP